MLGVNGCTRYMPTTGGRPDIGPTTEANARWLITQDRVRGQLCSCPGAGGGQHPWHYYDMAKGHGLSILDNPKLWIDFARQRPALTDRGNGIGLDHRPRP